MSPNRGPRGVEHAAVRAVRRLYRTAGHERVYVRALDLSQPGSVDAFVRAWSGPLDILVANAGLIRLPQMQRSPRGHRAAVRDQPPGAFPTRARPAPGAAGSARIVSLSSRGHLRSPVVFEASTSSRGCTIRCSPTGSRRPPTCSSGGGQQGLGGRLCSGVSENGFKTKMMKWPFVIFDVQ